MGQCGCADTEPDLRFKAPDGQHYGLEVYSSCHYCSTPAGVILHRFDADAAAIWLEGVPEAEFVEGACYLPVLEPRRLAAALNGGDEEDEHAVEIMAEDIAYALPEAIHQTLAEWFRADTGEASRG